MASLWSEAGSQWIAPLRYTLTHDGLLIRWIRDWFWWIWKNRELPSASGFGPGE